MSCLAAHFGGSASNHLVRIRLMHVHIEIALIDDNRLPESHVRRLIPPDH